MNLSLIINSELIKNNSQKIKKSAKILRNMLKRLFSIFFLSIFFISTFFAQESTFLTLSQPIQRDIKGGETQPFLVKLLPNQTARIEIEQKGIDVSIAAFKPNGEKFIETESPSGLLGNDLILVTATEIGDYKIEISPADPKSPQGKYIVQLAEIRQTIPNDLEINQATAEILKLANETVPLRQSGTRENRRQAIEKFSQIITLSKIKKDKVWEIVALVSSGLIYEQLGEFQKALTLYLQSLDLCREIGNRQYEGTTLNNLAVNYNALGEYENGILYLNQAIALQRETGNKRGEAINLNNFGTTYLLLNDLPKAESFYQQALVLRRELKDQRGEGFALNNLGQVFAKSGDLIKATDFFQQALTLRRTIGDKSGEATTLQNLGKVFWNSGDKTKGFEHFTNANLLAKQVGDRRIEADSFYWLAVAEKDKDNLPKAIENIENGLNLIEKIRGELLNPELRISYFSTVQQFYELYTELVVAQFEKSKSESELALALQISERARTRNLVELLQEARINIKQGIDEKTLENMQNLQDSLNAKYRQRTQLLNGKPTAEQVSKITGEINLLTTELENLQSKIRRENPRFAELTQGETLSAKQIQNLLDDETVLLEYKLGKNRSFLWLVTKNSTQIFTLPSTEKITPIAKNYYDLILTHKKTDEAKLADLSKQLNEILLANVKQEINGKRVAIVADGILQYIPFSTLAEKNEIITLPSASVLAELRRTNANKIPQKTLAIFADAVFEANDPRLPPTAQNAENISELKKVMRDFNNGENLSRLLSSRIEARNISTLLAKEKFSIFTDFDANRENIFNQNLENYQILHFATHGLLDTLRPANSGLVLSLFNQKGKSQNGFLPLNQIYNLNLNSDLVVLSACQTALGKDVKGEGLIGLTRGFMYAGAKRVIASLWKVDDAATAEFMKRFYQNLLVKKLKPSTALYQTQSEMKQIPRFKSPYYWAGFTIQGDWK